ncbi:hypothetical protein Lal_00038534 [Lupinus albus]|nr:hypothetical protein Lal_00038534 [Lupinus albus]
MTLFEDANLIKKVLDQIGVFDSVSVIADHDPEQFQVVTPAKRLSAEFYQSWDSRLSDVFLLGRERLTWEGEILSYTGGFSPERELAHLSEKGSTGRVKSWAILEDSRLSKGWLA